MGVFATRSPYRPNSIGLSSVKLESIEYSDTLGPVLHVSGADLANGTPIFDVKPYLPYTDSHPEATGGFSEEYTDQRLKVEIDPEIESVLPEDLRQPVREMLAADPRPGYQNDPKRIYGMELSGYNIRFQIDKDTATVTEITKIITDKEEQKR